MGTYHPDPAQSQQAGMTSLDQIRNDGYATLGSLNQAAPCEKFAEHMSIVHPANNGPFSMTMQCIADARGFQESDTPVAAENVDQANGFVPMDDDASPMNSDDGFVPEGDDSYAAE